MAEIRQADELDLPRLMELGRAMHAEAPTFRGLDFDAAKVEATLRHAMNQGLVLVHVDDEGRIDGGFVGVIVERWFSRSELFTDLALFVEPTRRGGFTACRLLRRVVAWCKERGLKPEDVQLGVSTGVHAEETGRLFEKLGFERFGGLYRLRGF